MCVPLLVWATSCPVPTRVPHTEQKSLLELEADAGAARAPVDDCDRFDAAACRARLVESGENLSASRFPMMFIVQKIVKG